MFLTYHMKIFSNNVTEQKKGQLLPLSALIGIMILWFSCRKLTTSIYKLDIYFFKGDVSENLDGFNLDWVVTLFRFLATRQINSENSIQKRSGIHNELVF